MPTESDPLADTLPSALRRWDIFCNVIDNFGDIGVCWRLARQLANEHGASVRLWVDDLASFRPLCPELDVACDAQTVSTGQAGVGRATQVEVRRWTTPFSPVSSLLPLEPSDVVIEAFACRLPESYERAMAARQPAPVWINLDYLSAEDWVAGCHALPSPHPRLPLTKYFFYPGFNAKTGGLLLEHGLDAARQNFKAEPEQQAEFWRRLGFAPPDPGTQTLTVFAYENPALPRLLDMWAGETTPTCLLLPPTRTQASVEAWLGEGLPPGRAIRRGALEIRAVPFVDQIDFDRLLWLGDANFVRGEDSFVRAQWAATPFVWHIYPQEDGAHQVKLEAFLARYTEGLSPAAARAVREVHAAWNGFTPPDEAAKAWHAWRAARPELEAHALRWQKNLQKQEDLCSALVRFCRTKL